MHLEEVPVAIDPVGRQRLADFIPVEFDLLTEVTALELFER
jgi:hypothetical protein